MSLKFYDTNALLELLNKAFEEPFVCSSKTLEEIENIKVSDKKDPDIKYKARKLAHLLDTNKDKYHTIIATSEVFDIINEYKIEIKPDNIIIASAYKYCTEIQPIIFVSNDICCKLIASEVFGLPVKNATDYQLDTYCGFKEVVLGETEMAYFYSNQNTNLYDLLTNEYLIIKNSKLEVIDKLMWNGISYSHVNYDDINSYLFGCVKAYKGDVYQQCTLDSLSRNQITMIKGSAGTGKSYLALAYLFHKLEKSEIDKIIIFCNTVSTINSAKIGFLPGSKDEKLLASSIGNMLCAKLGSKYAVQQLIDEEKLELLPMSDIRGFDTTGMNAGIYVTESQNMDISLMKLALQRMGDDCICIIEGDFKTQVDLSIYSGSNNGMRRMSEVFRGQDFYGEVELQNIYRSKIAAIAESM